MANNNQVPGWLKQLWKELTTPPHFVPQPKKKPESDKPKDTGASSTKSSYRNEEERQEEDDRPSWWSSWSISPVDVKQQAGKKKRANRHARQTSHKKGKPTKVQKKKKSVPKVCANPPSPSNKKAVPLMDPFYSQSESSWLRVAQSEREIEQMFIRHGYHPDVMERYPFSIYKAEPFGPIIRLKTSKGIKALKRTRLAPERIEFIDQAIRYVMKRGFTRITPFTYTKNKTPYAIVGGNVYYASDWVFGQECDFTSMIHLAEAAQTLAQFHHASQGFEPSVTSPPMAFNIFETFQRRSKDLSSFKKKLQIKEKRDAMDSYFLDHVDEYMKQAQKAIRIVSDPSVKEFLSKEAHQGGLCHLDVTPQNLVYTSKHHVHLIDLDFMTFAPRALDIAHLIRRSMQKTGWSREASLVCLVNVNSVKKILREEYLLIHALLTFPYRFWHIAYAHYALKATGQSLGYMQQLQSLEGKRHAFLQSFEQEVQR